MELAITFRILREHGACAPRYAHLARALGGVRTYGKDTPIPLLTALDLNGLEDVEWVLDREAVPAAQMASLQRLKARYWAWADKPSHKCSSDAHTAKLRELLNAPAQD